MRGVGGDLMSCVLYRVFNPGIPDPGIPGSRPIFSIPNPGIGDALIPGFRDYKNCKLHAEKVKFGAYFLS